jgi:hypothetical protein
MFCNYALPPTFIDNSLGLSVALNERRVEYFTNLLCRPDFSIPIQTNWLILIEPSSPNLIASIVDVAENYEPVKNYISQNIKNVMREDFQQIIGCVFASAIDIPGESLGYEFSGGGGGYRKSPVTNVRGEYGVCEIGFLETNTSFTDYFIRPWLNLVGYKGLAARSPETSVKAQIHIIQLGQTGPGKPQSIRKYIKLRGAAPVNISSERLSYDNGSNNDLMRQCQFVFTDLSIYENF